MKALSIQQPISDPAFGNWLAGFIDGEGCFFFHKRAGFSPPQFAIKLRDDDRAILDECVQRTGIGYVKPVKRKGRSRPQSKWLLTKRGDCVVLVRILDNFPLRAKKLRDYVIWREAVLLWASQKKIARYGGGTLKYAKTAEIEALSVRLRAERAYR